VLPYRLNCDPSLPAARHPDRRRDLSRRRHRPDLRHRVRRRDAAVVDRAQDGARPRECAPPPRIDGRVEDTNVSTAKTYSGAAVPRARPSPRVRSLLDHPRERDPVGDLGRIDPGERGEERGAAGAVVDGARRSARAGEREERLADGRGVALGDAKPFVCCRLVVPELQQDVFSLRLPFRGALVARARRDDGGNLARLVCTSTGCASSRLSKNPPRLRTVAVPSSWMAVIS